MQSTVEIAISNSRLKRKASGDRKHARRGNRKTLPRRKATPINTLGRALRALFPDNVPTFERLVLEVLQHKTNREQIRSWRRGLAKPPAWALQLIEQELDKRIQEMTEAHAEIKKERAAKNGPEIRY